MPRPNKKIRLSSYQKAQLAIYINNFIVYGRRSGESRDSEAFLEKAKRSVVSILKDMGVGVDQAELIALNLTTVFVNYRSGDSDYVEDIVNVVCDESS